MNKEEIKHLAKEHVERNHVPEAYKTETLEMVETMMAQECFGNPNYEWNLDHFELAHRLGRGKFGRVYLAREKRSGFLVAMKTLLKREIWKNGAEKQIVREIEIQSNLRHPNILQLLCWFHDDFRIYLCLEYAGNGELYMTLKNSPGGRFDDHLSAKYVYQVADALNYCHENNVIHRDIKPENLLLTIQNDVKLADFGWSVHALSFQRETMCGTLDYLPPEIVKGAQYGKYVDHWCLGVLLYEFLVGKPPFESGSNKETYDKILNLAIVFPSHVPKGARDLIKRLLVLKGDDRLSLTEVMKHYWIQNNMSLI